MQVPIVGVLELLLSTQDHILHGIVHVELLQVLQLLENRDDQRLFELGSHLLILALKLVFDGLLVSVLLTLRDAEVFLQGWIGTGLVWGWESKEATFGALNASRLTLSSGALRILVTLSYL
jgi:hypothetical protein